MATTSTLFVASADRLVRVTHKPVPLTAWQYQGESTLEGAPDWVRNYEIDLQPPILGRISRVEVDSLGNSGTFLLIPTKEGPIRVNPGDWLIQDLPRGEITPCNNEVFERDYHRESFSVQSRTPDQNASSGPEVKKISALNIPFNDRFWWALYSAFATGALAGVAAGRETLWFLPITIVASIGLVVLASWLKKSASLKVQSPDI